MPITWTKDGGGSVQLGAPHSFWNQKLPDEFPIDPDSDAYCSAFVSKAYGGNNRTNFQNKDYSVGVFIAQVGCPRYKVTIDRPPGQAGAFKLDDFEQNPFASVPIPDEARPSFPMDGTAPAGSPGFVDHGASSGDNHLAIYEPSTDTLWEMWKARKVEVDGPSPAVGQATGVDSATLNTPGWHMQYGGAMKNASQSVGYYDNTAWNGSGNGWGATATKIPKSMGVITTSEGLAARDKVPNAIPHAIACAINQARRWPHLRWPAQATDGGGGLTDPEEGMIFRFRADADYTALKNAHPFVGAFAEAVRDYGLVIMDQAAALSIYCECHDMNPASKYGTQPDVWWGAGNFDVVNAGAVFDGPAVNNATNTFGMPQYIPWTDLQLIGSIYRPTSPLKRRLLFAA